MEHLSALRFNSRRFVRPCCLPKPLHRLSRVISYHLSNRQTKKGKKKTDLNVRKLSAQNRARARARAIRKATNQSVRCAFALLCLFIPCGQTWTPYTRCWSRQAKSVETRQTHHLRLPQQNTPPPVQQPLRQRGPPPIPVPRPPLVRRTTKNSCRPWNVRRNPENFPTYRGGLRCATFAGISVRASSYAGITLPDSIPLYIRYQTELYSTLLKVRRCSSSLSFFIARR